MITWWLSTIDIFLNVLHVLPPCVKYRKRSWLYYLIYSIFYQLTWLWTDSDCLYKKSHMGSHNQRHSSHNLNMNIFFNYHGQRRAKINTYSLYLENNHLRVCEFSSHHQFYFPIYFVIQVDSALGPGGSPKTSWSALEWSGLSEHSLRVNSDVTTSISFDRTHNTNGHKPPFQMHNIGCLCLYVCHSAYIWWKPLRAQVEPSRMTTL